MPVYILLFALGIVGLVVFAKSFSNEVLAGKADILTLGDFIFAVGFAVFIIWDVIQIIKEIYR